MASRVLPVIGVDAKGLRARRQPRPAPRRVCAPRGADKASTSRRRGGAGRRLFENRWLRTKTNQPPSQPVRALSHHAHAVREDEQEERSQCGHAWATPAEGGTGGTTAARGHSIKLRPATRGSGRAASARFTHFRWFAFHFRSASPGPGEKVYESIRKRTMSAAKRQGFDGSVSTRPARPLGLPEYRTRPHKQTRGNTRPSHRGTHTHIHRDRNHPPRQPHKTHTQTHPHTHYTCTCHKLCPGASAASPHSVKGLPTGWENARLRCSETYGGSADALGRGR